MISDNMGRIVKPESADLIENLPFKRDISQNTIKGALPVGCDKHKSLAQIVWITYFAFPQTADSKKRCIIETITEMLSDYFSGDHKTP